MGDKGLQEIQEAEENSEQQQCHSEEQHNTTCNTNHGTSTGTTSCATSNCTNHEAVQTQHPQQLKHEHVVSSANGRGGCGGNGGPGQMYCCRCACHIGSSATVVGYSRSSPNDKYTAPLLVSKNLNNKSYYKAKAQKKASPATPYVEEKMQQEDSDENASDKKSAHTTPPSHRAHRMLKLSDLESPESKHLNYSFCDSLHYYTY